MKECMDNLIQKALITLTDLNSHASERDWNETFCVWKKWVLHKEMLGCGLSFVVREHYECTGAFDRQKSVFTVGVWWWRLAERRLQTLRQRKRECDWFSMAFTAEPQGRGPTSQWMGQWLLNLRCRMHEGMNEYRQIYTFTPALNSSSLEPKGQPVRNFKSNTFQSDSITMNLISACTGPDKGWARLCLKNERLGQWESSALIYTLNKNPNTIVRL